MSSGAGIEAALSAAASDAASALQGQAATTPPEAAKDDTVPESQSSSKRSKALKPQRTPKKKGRPPKAKGTEAIEWSDGMAESLMRLRYETYQKKFTNARNNAMIRAAWLLLAAELSKKHDVLISSEQCKNKIKALKKKWAEYCSDRNATGNDVDNPVAEPSCLAMMEEYWTSETGMRGDTLADNDNIGELLESDSDDDSSSSRKKAKTVAEGMEQGMKAMSEGFHAVAAAIARRHEPTETTGQATTLESVMEDRFNTVIDQLHVQNRNLASLIELLSKK